MNNRTPGFHAEASAYRSRARVAAVRDTLEAGAGVVTPAAPWYDYACAASCSAACEPAILGGFDSWTHCLDGCFTFCAGHPPH